MTRARTFPSAHDAEAQAAFVQLDQAFAEWLDLPVEERGGWLRNLGEEKPELSDRLTHVLERERGSRDLFDLLDRYRLDTLEELVPDRADAEQDPRIGRHYGPWLVTGHLGSGGLAEVYRVDRDDDRYEQRAALKILRSGLFGGYARDLFLRERRLLANLDHPGIVRIIDAGETTTGAPWLVMELAEGPAIDAYCEAVQMPLAGRLELVAQAADVLQAAHGRMVLHGDIKPDHIIVQDNGSVRLLDFGIAQALGEQGIGQTSDGFSPRTASPEQRENSPLTVASDIFQLGMVLNGLCEGQDVSASLSAVIARTTDPNPALRYSAASALADDLRAITDDRAPSVLPDRPVAALWRLARHHRVAAALAILVVLGSFGWAITASLSAAAIDRERGLAVAAADRERRGKDVLLTLFRRADLLEADSLGLTPEASVEMLDNVLADARATLADDPAILADLTGWAARAHQRADDLAGALELARESAALAATADNDSLSYAAAQAYLGDLLIASGSTEAGAALVAQSLTRAERADLHEPALLDLLLSAAWSHEAEWPVQEALFRRALAAAEAQNSVAVEIEARSGRGRALVGLDRLDEARTEIETSLALTEARFGENHPRMSLPLSDLGRLEERNGNYAAAATFHRRALAISSASFGPSHHSTRPHRTNLAIVLLGMGDYRAAITEFARLQEDIPDGEEYALARAEVAQNLGAALTRQGRFAETDEPLALAEQIFSRLLPAGNPRRAFPALTRAEVRLGQRRWEDAASNARVALDQLSATLPVGHFAIETARCRLGIALIGQGRTAEGAPLVRAAYSAMQNSSAAVPAVYLAPCRSAAQSL